MTRKQRVERTVVVARSCAATTTPLPNSAPNSTRGSAAIMWHFCASTSPVDVLDAKISPLHARVRQQRLVAAMQRDASGLQNVAVVAGFERLDHTLLDQQD